MLNTLFDLLNYHINYTEYDLITFATNNERRIKSLINLLIEISKFNNIKFLYFKLNEDTNDSISDRFILDNSKYINEIENKIYEFKNEIKFIIVNDFDSVKCNNTKDVLKCRQYLSNVMKKISINLSIPIILVKKNNTKNGQYIIRSLEALGQDSDLIIYENNKYELKVLKNRYGYLFEIIDY